MITRVVVAFVAFLVCFMVLVVESMPTSLNQPGRPGLSDQQILVLSCLVGVTAFEIFPDLVKVLAQ